MQLHLTYQEICIIMFPSSQGQKAERGKMKKHLGNISVEMKDDNKLT